MSSHARIVPVSNKDGAIGCDGNITRTKPLVFLCLQEIFDPRFVACSVIFYNLRSHYVMAGLAMNEL